MSLKKSKWLFGLIKFKRYILRKKFITVFDGPLKGYLWNTSYNYDYILGTYEDPEALKIFCSWLKEDTVLYDLGANIGYYALMANQYIKTGVIYSFEPMPGNIRVFNKHLELNRKFIKNDNIKLMPFAISDADKKVSFSENKGTMEGNTYIEKSSVYTGAQDTFSVQSYSVDSLLQQGYRKPGIIKIDVEGAEYDVLVGAKNTLEKYHPKILLATHDTHLEGVKDQCIHFLKALGYKILPINSSNKASGGLEDFIAIFEENAS
ncbi:MAG: FkbM family methyltransferase [Ferruginibacter sp.]